jgi:hypothetical protein
MGEKIMAERILVHAVANEFSFSHSVRNRLFP